MLWPFWKSFTPKLFTIVQMGFLCHVSVTKIKCTHFSVILLSQRPHLPPQTESAAVQSSFKHATCSSCIWVHLNTMYPLKIRTLWTGTTFYVDNAWKQLAYIWRFTLRALPGASSVVAYETSNPHRSHTRSLEITWKRSENIYEQMLHQILLIWTLCKS